MAEAARRDPDCGLCAWGHAWALGPTINYGLDPEQLGQARAAALKAQALLAKGSGRDRMLADALVARYAPRGGDKAYAKAMQAIAARHPDDLVIQVWTADALMIADKPALAVPILETVLAREPDNAGAIHFYIHATEWIGQPGKAETYADALGRIAPGASHLIHMPSHTYYQIGRYRDAARVNIEAIEADAAWLKRTGGEGDAFKIGYYGHNVSYALGGAMMSGDAAAGLRLADHYRTIKTSSPWAKASAGRAWFAYGRYGDIDKVLAMPAPENAIQKTLWHYGRGEALARKRDSAGVRAEAAAVLASREAIKRDNMTDFIEFADIAYEVLLGRAAMLDGFAPQAAKHYRKAAELQERKLGDFRDPPPWWYPVRRSYAAALLADGKFDLAIKETDKVLAKWPHDPLTLLVASRAKAHKGQADAAETSLAAARREWVGSSLTDFAPALL
ncbi:MAG TPA: hypothetical protein VEA44_19360 [Caulobacter sp.]|nr:hypothetical protein [Caulobacter sp.]